MPGSIVEVDLEDGDLLTMEAQADFGESQGSKPCGIFLRYLEMGINGFWGLWTFFIVF